MRIKKSRPFSSIAPTKVRQPAPKPYKAFPVDKGRST